MKCKEFCERAGVSKKTAYWLYDNVFNVLKLRDPNVREFTDYDVKWVLDRKIENFGTSCPGIRITHIPGSTCYIADNGVVFNYRRGFLEFQRPHENFGYHICGITVNGVRKDYRISRLVGEYYVPNPEDKPVINHLDGNKKNNLYTNLEWSTISENTKHAFDHGLARNDKGYEDSQSIPVQMYDNDGNFIREFGSMGEASRITGFTKGYIYGNIRHNATKGTGGYYFTRNGNKNGV